MIDLSEELSHAMKDGFITATLMPRNSGLVPDNLPKSLLKKNWFGLKEMFCVWWNFEDVIHWEFVPIGHAVNVDLYSQQLE